MGTLLIILSIALIALVLLQSSKAVDAGQALMGGSSSLFAARKERGAELFISRLTMTVGLTFFITCLIMSFL